MDIVELLSCAALLCVNSRKGRLHSEAEDFGVGRFCMDCVAWRTVCVSMKSWHTAVPLRFFCCFPAQGAGLRELFVAVMPSHGEHIHTDGLFVDGINESCSFVNASASQTGEVAFEGFGLAGAGLGVHFEFFEQCHDFLQHLFLSRSFPIGEIFDGFREQLQIVGHRSANCLISSIEKDCAKPAACCCRPRRTAATFCGWSNQASAEGDTRSAKDGALAFSISKPSM